jgi:hypothetical protein
MVYDNRLRPRSPQKIDAGRPADSLKELTLSGLIFSPDKASLRPESVRYSCSMVAVSEKDES